MTYQHLEVTSIQWVNPGRPCWLSLAVIKMMKISDDICWNMVRILSGAFRFNGRRGVCLLLQLVLRAPLLRFRGCNFCSFPFLLSSFWLAVSQARLMKGSKLRPYCWYLFICGLMRKQCKSLRWYRSDVSSLSCRLHKWWGTFQRPMRCFEMELEMTTQFCFSGPGIPLWWCVKPVAFHAERAKSRTDTYMAVGNGCATLRGDRLEMCLAVLIPLFFDKPT